jgi:hypothetical protein
MNYLEGGYSGDPWPAVASRQTNPLVQVDKQQFAVTE